MSGHKIFPSRKPALSGIIIRGTRIVPLNVPNTWVPKNQKTRSPRSDSVESGFAEGPFNGRSKLCLARAHSLVKAAPLRNPWFARGPPSRKSNFRLAQAHLGRRMNSSPALAKDVKDLRNHEDVCSKCTLYEYLPMWHRGQQRTMGPRSHVISPTTMTHAREYRTLLPHSGHCSRTTSNGTHTGLGTASPSGEKYTSPKEQL